MFCDSVWISTWQYLPRIIFIDGTFLKGPVKGVLLIVIGINANNNIMILGVQFCKSETAGNWKIFLEKLKEVYPDWTDESKSLLIFSDQLIGLDTVLKELFPSSIHKYCAFHLVQLLKRKYKISKEVSKLIYKASRSTSEIEYLQTLYEIKEKNINTYNYLLNIPTKQWVNFYSNYPTYNFITSSPVESYNNAIKNIRKLCLVDIFINLRQHANSQKLIHKKELLATIDPSASELNYLSVMNNNMDKIKSTYTNYLNNILKDNLLKSTKVYVMQWDFNVYLAVDYKKTYYVNLNVTIDNHYFKCNCNYTKNTGIPCTHLISVCNYVKEDYHNYISEIYKLINIYKIYSLNYVYAPRPDEEQSIFNDSIKRKSKGAPETVRKKIPQKLKKKSKI